MTRWTEDLLLTYLGIREYLDVSIYITGEEEELISG